MSYKRVISLLPAATEIICALQATDCLVGISHECDFPVYVKSLPICTQSSIDLELSSNEIDQQVKESVLKGLSLYKLDLLKIEALKPDLIITQDQCKVCAISLDDLKQQLNLDFESPVEVISLQPSSVIDILQSIKTIASALNKEEELESLIESYEDRLAIIKHKIKFVKQRPTLVCIEWLEPLMVAGHWTPEIAELAGAEVLLSTAGSPSRYVTWDDLKSADPEFIFIAPCGFSMERTKKELAILFSHPFWKELKAVQGNKVFIADGNHYFNRSGPRIIDSAEILAEILQVNQFYFGLEGIAWEWVN